MLAQFALSSDTQDHFLSRLLSLIVVIFYSHIYSKISDCNEMLTMKHLFIHNDKGFIFVIPTSRLR